MKIKIPFVYHGIAVPPGMRKPRTVPFIGLLDVELHAVASSDTSVAVEWTQLDQRTDEPVRHRLRRHLDTLVRLKTVYDDGSDDYLPMMPEELTGLDAFTPGEISREAWETMERYRRGNPLLSPDDCRGYEAGDMDEIRARIEEWASGLVLIDGAVWELAIAPVVVVMPSNSVDGELWLEGDVVYTDRVRLEKFLEHSRASWEQAPVLIGMRRPELLEATARIMHSRGLEYLPCFSTDSIPEHLCGTDFEEGVLRSARMALAALPGDLRDHDVEVINRWVDLKVAAAALEEALDKGYGFEDQVDHVLEKWTDLSVEGIELGARRLRLLRDLWEGRSVEIGLAASPSLS